jgi:hypothetical protein
MPPRPHPQPPAASATAPVTAATTTAAVPSQHAVGSKHERKKPADKKVAPSSEAPSPSTLAAPTTPSASTTPSSSSSSSSLSSSMSTSSSSSSQLLSYFWNLANVDPAVRTEAARALIADLKRDPAASAEDVSYSHKRLVRGLSSNRAGARQVCTLCSFTFSCRPSHSMSLCRALRQR